MKTIDYLSHTADVRMMLRADSASELFEAALEGMNQIIKENGCQVPRSFPLIRGINLKSENLTTLLIEFLGEVLTQSHLNKALFCKLQIEHLSEREISASIHGYTVEEIDEDIKAVTYHEANVRRNATNQYETILVFDI